MMTNTSPLSDPGIVPDPYPVYAELAETNPVHWCEGLDAWAVVRYEDCAKALKNPQLKADRMEEILQAKFDGRAVPEDNVYHQFTKNVMMYTDPPVHDALRRATGPGFTHAAHGFYSDVIRKIADELVTALPDGPIEIDAVTELALQMPYRSSVRAFGVPEEDLEFIVPRVNALMTYWSGPQEQPIDFDDLLGRLDELHTYSLELLQGKRGTVLPDTVIARLAAAQETNVDATLQQTIHQLVLLFIALFAPTTPGSLSSGMKAFAENPAQVELFRADPAAAGNAANEVIRYNASNQFTWRLAAEPLEIGGVTIDKGQCLALFIGAANRDPRMFERPDEFDLSRSNSGKHLSFGVGLHSCLGRQIATLQVKWFYDALFSRYSSISLAGEPEWNNNLEFRSLKSLPLSLR
jgi:4-nitrotryptophan synthase